MKYTTNNSTNNFTVDDPKGVNGSQRGGKSTILISIYSHANMEILQLDLLTLRRINTADNESDIMTKNLWRTLFYRHMEYLMVKIPPEYVNTHT